MSQDFDDTKLFSLIFSFFEKVNPCIGSLCFFWLVNLFSLSFDRQLLGIDGQVPGLTPETFLAPLVCELQCWVVEASYCAIRFE